MELIPIIQESLLFFIAVLIIVLVVSYLLFKLNNKKEEQEIIQRQNSKSEYSHFLSEQDYTHPVKYIANVPQYDFSNSAVRDRVVHKTTKSNRYVIVNESNSDQSQFYKPNINFSNNLDKVNLNRSY